MGNASVTGVAASSAASGDVPVVKGRRIIALYDDEDNELVPQSIDASSLLVDASKLWGDAAAAERSTPPASRHCFVLCHGLSAFSTDLRVLEETLSSAGSPVLCSSSNEWTESFKGVHACAEALVAEIADFLAARPEVTHISLVGNSLGGVISRASAKLLHSVNWLGLEPYFYMSIACPHLGVRHFTYLESEVLGKALHSSIRDPLVDLMSTALRKTGKELLLRDAPNMKDSFMFKLATEREALDAMRAFKERRLFANLRNDLVVPLATAAFVKDDICKALRERHSNEEDVVAVLVARRRPPLDSSVGGGGREVQDEDTACLEEMRSALNALGWTKCIAHYPSVFPTAHSKIAAITRNPTFLHASVLDFQRGRQTMQAAALWLSGNGESERADARLRNVPNPLA